jgi:hypothetical protein
MASQSQPRRGSAGSGWPCHLCVSWTERAVAGSRMPDGARPGGVALGSPIARSCERRTTNVFPDVASHVCGALLRALVKMPFSGHRCRFVRFVKEPWPSRSSATEAQCRLFNGFGWQGMASPLEPLLQWRLRQLSSPGRAAHSSRAKKAALPPSSTPFRPSRCSSSKPLPSTSHRGRDGRGFDQLEGIDHG